MRKQCQEKERQIDKESYYSCEGTVSIGINNIYHIFMSQVLHYGCLVQHN
jgi:hypothetical protein